jgi:transposase/uncharacterized protein (UPF0248 family)
MEKVTMSTKEINQISIFEKLKEKTITQKRAAEILGLGERQVRNKIKRFRMRGPRSLIHGNRGKQSKKRWNPEEQAVSLQLLKTSEWKDFGPTFASEKLLELHQIKVSSETLRKVMIAEQLWIAQKRKPCHRMRRERKPNFGIMTQLDGSDHDWFEGRGPRCTLLVFIDDATSRLLWLQFVSGESTKEVMESTHSYFLKHGKPRSFYVDRASVFKITRENSDNNRLSQFARAMKDLQVEMIYAHSAPAKGRVERFNKTAQDRLIKEMRLAQISTIEEANTFVRDIYIPLHNAKFAVMPALPEDAHQPVNECELNDILCIKSARIVQNDYTVSYHNRILQITKQIALVRPKDTIIIAQRLDNSLYLTCRNKKLQFTEINQRPIKEVITRKGSINAFQKPAADHPWRSYTNRQYENKNKRTQMEVILGY